MRKLLFIAGLVPSACATAPAQVAPPSAPCSNDSLAGFAGQVATSGVGAAMLAASGARVIRWVAPGMAVTMDYREDRLTVRLDSANRIVSASCG